MTSRIRFAFAWLPLVLVAGFASTATADDRFAADLLPETTVLFVELPEPATIVDLLQTHPLRERIEALDGVKKGKQSKQFIQFATVVAMVGAKLGHSWPEVLTMAAEGGVAIAVDSASEGVAVLVRSQDEQTLPAILDTLLGLARADAEKNGRSNPVVTGDYRGISAHKAGEARIATFGRWLVVTNKQELGKAVLDNYLDAGPAVLSGVAQFQQTRSSMRRDATGWAYANLAALRDAGVAKDLYRGQADNAVAELLFGGILGDLKETPLAAARLDIDKTRMKLEFSIPHDSQWVSEARAYYFGPAGDGAAPQPLAVKDPIAMIGAYRDVSTMWLRAGDLFDEKTNDGLAQADSNLSTLFAGKDFGEDILGAIEPDVQIVVVRQRFPEGSPQPRIKLPAFALVARLKDAKRMQPEFRRTFQSLIGFLNVVGAMNGQPQLDLGMEGDDGRQLISGTYLVDSQNPEERPINFNFSPSIAFSGEHVIISSTKDLARELAASVAANQYVPAQPANTAVRLNVAGLREILNDNRGQLVAQNMIEEGRSQEEAEQAIGELLSLVEAIGELSLRLGIPGDALKLSLEVTFTN